MSTSVNKKERPQSSMAQRVTAAATLYNGLQLKALREGQQELIQSSKQILSSSLRQEEIQKSIDFGIRRLESMGEDQLKLSAESLYENKKQTQYMADQDGRDKVRFLKEELKEQKDAEIQSYKDITHSINREQQLIFEAKMTNLEKFFTLQKLHRVITSVDSNIFPQVSDKTYRDETEDSVKEKLAQIQDELCDQDKVDIKTITEIEELDENTQASELLKKVDAEIAVSEAIAILRRKISRKKKLSDSDYKDFTKKINQLRKEAK
jgi:ATP-dependent Lon protease